MRYKDIHVDLPEDLAHEIDAIVGRRGRSKFLVEAARYEIRRRKSLDFQEEATRAHKRKRDTAHETS